MDHTFHSETSPGMAPAHELFALTDEQILDIVPDAQSDSSSAILPNSPAALRNDGSRVPTEPNTSAAHVSAITRQAEPPAWLAELMNDPQAGVETRNEARDLWNGIQQAQQEAAAYREVFAKPEDARALKEMYPGGVEQAHATAERARTLEEIDAAFYGGAGKSAPEISAGREALAQRMLREDPAAFREMVFAGLRALEGAAQLPPNGSTAQFAETSAQHSSGTHGSASPVAQPFRAASEQEQLNAAGPNTVGFKPSTTQIAPAENAAHQAQLAQYTAFEKSANEELERSVGGAIQRALQQALPVAQPLLAVHDGARNTTQTSGTNHSAANGSPAIQERLGSAIRQEVETALKGDRQLGEQIAQVLSTRRFDEATRMQVVRLINDRAQQLVPTASRRVIQEWTQTAFATHRAKTQSSAAENEFPPSRVAPRDSSGNTAAAKANVSATASAVSARAAAANRAEQSAGLAPVPTRARNSALNYRKLSDEQILDL